MSVVKALISRGSDVNSTSKEGLSALSISIDNNNAELVKVLIENGAQCTSTMLEHLTETDN